MLDIVGDNHAKTTATAVPAGAAGKRIPASLQKMRSAALASSGKYKQLEALAAANCGPDMSLMSMAKQRCASRASYSGGGGTAARGKGLLLNTSSSNTPRSLKEALDKASEHLKSCNFDFLNGQENGLEELTKTTPKLTRNMVTSSPSTTSTPSISSISSHSTHSKRSSLRMPQRQKTQDELTPPRKPCRDRRIRRPRRSLSTDKTEEEGVIAIHQTIAATLDTEHGEGGEEQRPTSSVTSLSRRKRDGKCDRQVKRPTRKPSNKTPIPVVKKESQSNCWTCSQCDYAKNKSTFIYCGKCGIPKAETTR